MSSPIAISRSSSSSSLSSSAAQSGLYVPVHKRQSGSPTSSRSPSPTLLSEASPSWRSHSPSKSPSAAFRNKHRKTPSNASHRKLHCLLCLFVQILMYIYIQRFYRTHPYTQTFSDTLAHCAPKHIFYINTAHTLINSCISFTCQGRVLDWTSCFHSSIRER